MARWVRRPEGSNWGDFGEDDQLGRMNLLGPAERLRGVREVHEGLAFTLSLPLDYPGGSGINPDRHPPKLVATAVAGEERSTWHRCLSHDGPHFHDVINDEAVLLYPQYSTQWDALGHFGVEFDADGDGAAEIRFYNGYGADDLIHPDRGGPRAAVLGIENLAEAGVQGRGVMADLAAVFGRERARIGYDGLMRALEATGAEVGRGDILCVHTGYATELLAQRREPDARFFRNRFAGLDGADERLLRWITDSGIVAICADNPAVEIISVRPRQPHRHAMLPLHEHCLFRIGVHLGELWHLGDLAAWLAANRRSAFLLTAPPLRLPGAVGSPVTPIATV